ncbi:MAG TPA: C39 family peptidase [Vicinamibacterales bacterium]|nr:C39 family peptidase [Vicinamibacterales bacterium]
MARLEVPYLPQTELLCGGAAVAMLFRYWGDRHASAQQFAPLVDRRAGGIADTALITAVEERRWSAVRLTGSIESLRAELGAGRPPIILIEDRPQRYHYVVVVGVEDAAVVVHDPTWGPARRHASAALLRAWEPTGFWMLRITPVAGVTPLATTTPADSVSAVARQHTDACDAALDSALDDLSKNGLGRSGDVLGAVAAQCPDDARPLRELAAVRFTERRWEDASAAARDALVRDPADAYAANVLASSRFMVNDVEGALQAWNIAARPRLDAVRISGLTRMRYARLADLLAFPDDSLITSARFTLARRRLEELPDISSTRISLRPQDDGFAEVDVAVVESRVLPHSLQEWAATGARTAIERQVGVHVPGRTGQGEAWTSSFRWWRHRPAAALEFAAPVAGRVSGVWHVGMSWDVQTYGPIDAEMREERLRGEVGLATWVAPHVRVFATSGLDTWRTGATRNRTITAGGGLERRLFNDRVAAQVSLMGGAGLSSSRHFAVSSAALAARTSRGPRPLVVLARAGVSNSSAAAPLAFWNGAGDGLARGPLLRAHSLVHDGRLDSPVFGRRLAYASVEAQHWFARPSLLRVAVATFADAAAAWQRPLVSRGSPAQVDGGVGLRVRVPAVPGAMRVDYAHGLRDGADAWTVGWQIE